jgi:asparagine synthase (glutamine-hydrolysing)
MSGIGGIFFADGRPVEQEMLDAMVRGTPLLGIDGTSTWRDGPAGLVRFALITTPEAVNEVQPYADPRSGRVIAFDGRIDNRAELLGLLGAEAPASDAPDCVIVLAAQGKLGDEFVHRMTGDYGLAIWDPAKRRLFCARSPIGWRPFLWTWDGNRFGLATEPATLVRGLGMPREINLGAVGEHLSNRFVTHTETLWKGVNRLPPGHSLAFENGSVRIWRWHEGPFEDLSRLSDAEHVERFRDLLDQGLIATTRSNLPATAQLSGGLDSSTVVCRIQDLVGQGRIGAMVGTVSARYPGEICDEGEWIEAVEERCGIESATVHGAPFDREAAAAWSRDSLHLPLRPNTAGTTQAVANWLHARGLRVVLTGEGGDDWMNGGRSHWPDLLMQGRWLALLREGMTAEPGRGAARGIKSILADGLGPLVSPRRRGRALHPHLDFQPGAPEWVRPEFAREAGLADRWASAQLPPRLAQFTQMQRYVVYAMARRHVNADNVLSYIASKGVELRHPLHHLPLTRFLMGASGGMLRRNNSKKHILREAMRGTLPELVRTRTSKANISGPIIEGAEVSIAERPIRDLHCVRLGWVDPERLEGYQAAHEQWRQHGNASNVPDLPYAPVWNAIAIDLWLENAVRI